MDLQSWRPIAEAVTAIGVAIATIWAGWRYVWPMIVCFFARLRTVWNTLEQMPGLLTEYHLLQGQVHDFAGVANMVSQALDHKNPESVPNRMTYLVEQGNERGAQLKAQGDQISNVAAKVDTLSNTLRASQNTNPRLATFEADEKGRCIYVNKTYLRWTGLSLAETLGWAWMNGVHPDHREAVRADWLQAIADARRFQKRYMMVSTDGSTFEVDCSAEPIPEGTTPAERWIGSIYRVTTGQPPP